jgi:putative spermidine/putrescine transport system permease protein
MRAPAGRAALRMRWRRPVSGWLPVLPLLAFLGAFYVVPLASLLRVSVTDPEPGLGNYRRLLASEPMQHVLFTTLRISAETTSFALLLGYVVAYVMQHVRGRHRAWIVAFVLVPFWVSVLARAFAWLTLLRDEGLVNAALLRLGLIATPLPLVRNELGVLIGMVHYMIPYAVLPLAANMRGIDARLLAASRSLGAGPVRSFLRIYLPLSMPGIYVGGLLVFILSLGFLVTPAILGGGRVVMISEYIRLQIFQTVRWGVGTMMATVLLAAVLLLLAATARLVDVRALFGAK